MEALLQEAGWLRKLALHLVGDEHAAEDLVQETLTVAVRRPARATFESPRAWLGGIARNAARRSQRSTRHRGDRESRWAQERALGGASSAEMSMRIELQSIVGEELVRLPEPYRRTLYEHYYECRPFEEIAEREGDPAGTVRARALRGRALLRQALVARDGRAWSEWSAALAPLVGVGRVTVTGGAAIAPSVPWLLAAAALLAAIGGGSWYGLRPEPISTPESAISATNPAGVAARLADALQPLIAPVQAPDAGERSVAAPLVEGPTSENTMLGGGRILSLGGGASRPIEGARVAFERNGRPRLQAEVDGATWATTRLVDGRWTLRAWAEAHAPIEITVDVPSGPDWRFDIELAPVGAVPVRLETPSGGLLPPQYRRGGAFEGSLWVVASSERIPDILERPRNHDAGPPPESTWTDRHQWGRSLAQLSTRYAGELRLSTEGALDVALVLGTRVVARGRVRDGDEELVIQVAESDFEAALGRVRLRVLDPVSGLPLAGVACLLQQPRSASARGSRTADDGLVELLGLAGPATLHLSRSSADRARGFGLERALDLEPGVAIQLEDLPWPADPARLQSAGWTVGGTR